MKEPKSRYRRAVGLEYDEHGREAPIVGVKGDNRVADEIVKAAKRYGVPVVPDGPLTRALSEVEVDEEIPSNLFEAVAALLEAIDTKLAEPKKREPTEVIPKKD